MQNIFILDNKNGNKEVLFQWDLDQRFIVADSNIKQAHYYVSAKEEPLSCEVYEESGVLFVNIPNILLQKSGKYRVYAYDMNATVTFEQFEVISRPKPTNYIYTETELATVEAEIQKILKEAVESGIFNGKDGRDGKDGVDGKDGKDGYTPVKGKDYWNEQDISEIENYASTTVQEQLTKEQENLNTTDKTLIGAINEVAVDITKKLDSKASATNKNKCYAVNYYGEDVLVGFSQSVDPSYIVVRTSAGGILVPEIPKNANAAVSKAYVDNLILGVEETIDMINEGGIE